MKRAQCVEKGATPSNLSGTHPELFLERLQGNIELVWCNDGKKEGFIDPFVKAFFHCDKTNPNAVKMLEDLKKKTGVFVAVSRRISREKNESQFKEGNHDGLFKLKCFLQTKANCAQFSKNLRPLVVVMQLLSLTPACCHFVQCAESSCCRGNNSDNSSNERETKLGPSQETSTRAQRRCCAWGTFAKHHSNFLSGFQNQAPELLQGDAAICELRSRERGFWSKAIFSSKQKC